MAKKKTKAKPKTKKKVRRSRPKAAKKRAVRKSKPARKTSRKKPASKRAAAKLVHPVYVRANGQVSASSQIEIGHVEDYFARIGVIALTLKEPLATGETIHVQGHTTKLLQTVQSMQIDHVPVHKARKGDGVGIKVGQKCRKGDKVFKVG